MAEAFRKHQLVTKLFQRVSIGVQWLLQLRNKMEYQILEAYRELAQGQAGHASHAVASLRRKLEHRCARAFGVMEGKIWKGDPPGLAYLRSLLHVWLLVSSVANESSAVYYRYQDLCNDLTVKCLLHTGKFWSRLSHCCHAAFIPSHPYAAHGASPDKIRSFG